MAAVSIRRGTVPNGECRPPGDKSITHRAVLFGALAEGETRLTAFNPGEDCANSVGAAIALGARVERSGDELHIVGNGGRLRQPDSAIECGNSGTTMRLVSGIVARLEGETTLVGDASLSSRPMRRIAEPLERMGARVSGQGERLTAPLRIRGGALVAIAHAPEVASAQVAACVMLAGLAARGTTQITMPGPARDHTERMLPAFGVSVAVEPMAHGGRRMRLEGGQTLRAAELRVPGDPSAAAFLWALAAATPGAEVTARRVSLNPTRAGFLRVLEIMGVEVTVSAQGEEAGEPVGDVTVRGPRSLKPFDVPAEWAPTLIDEVPAWIVAASAAQGVSRVRGAAELRVKESDRISTLVDGLSACGLEAHAHADGLSVRGGEPSGGVVETRSDHRIAMAFAALGARSEHPVGLDDADCIRTSDPAFLDVLSSLGVRVERGGA